MGKKSKPVKDCWGIGKHPSEKTERTGCFPIFRPGQMDVQGGRRKKGRKSSNSMGPYDAKERQLAPTRRVLSEERKRGKE